MTGGVSRAAGSAKGTYEGLKEQAKANFRAGARGEKGITLDQAKTRLKRRADAAKRKEQSALRKERAAKAAETRKANAAKKKQEAAEKAKSEAKAKADSRKGRAMGLAKKTAPVAAGGVAGAAGAEALRDNNQPQTYYR
jgi:hypothetical protein